MSGRRWGDSSDEDEEGPAVMPIARQKATKETAPDKLEFSEADGHQYVDCGQNHVDEQQETPMEDEPEVEEEVVSEEEDSEDESEDEEERQRRIDAAKEAAAKKKAEQEAKKVTVDDQLDNLDDILNEFGIDTSEPKENKATEQAKSPVMNEGKSSSSRSSKRKKSKKKKGDSSSNGYDESVSESLGVDAPTTIDPDAAAKVLKAKLAGSKTKKPKSTAQSAAAVAAKEMQSSGDKKKKKKAKNNQNFVR